MSRVVLVMHAPLATAFAQCAEHVLGAPAPMCVIDVSPDDEPSAIHDRVLECLLRVPNKSCLVLCDLYGATPFNNACRAVASARGQGVQASLVSGANLNMVLKALTDKTDPVHLNERVLRSALRGIVCPAETGDD